MSIEHYLARYAEPEASTLPSLGDYARSLVIPCYAEGARLLAALDSVPGPDTLVIVVTNETVDAPEHGRTLNRKTRAALGLEDVDATLQLRDATFGALLWVDRTGPRALPPNQGVGLARKIGGDVALALHHRGHVRSPLICYTDADAILPASYFSSLEVGARDPTIAALLHPFRHAPESESQAEIVRVYELSLHYYVAGLASAGSPYAFHTVGSTITAHARAYAAVRGMPKRQAAEDFYFLNKLAKVGRVETVASDAIVLSGRSSDRVPFGTGAAIRDWQARSPADYPFYDPRVFAVSSDVLSAMDDALAHPTEPVAALLYERLASWPAAVRETVEQRRLAALVEGARLRSPQRERRRQHVHHAFDAFQTLKLIHALRERCFPSLPWREALARAAFFSPSSFA